MCSPPGHREEAFERPRDPGQADGELQLGPLSFFGVSQLLNVWQEPFLEHSISLPHRSPLDLGFPLNRVRVFGFLPSKSLQSEVMVAWLYLFSFPGTRGPASTAQQPQLRVRHGFPGGGQMGRLASAPTLFNRLFLSSNQIPSISSPLTSCSLPACPSPMPSSACSVEGLLGSEGTGALLLYDWEQDERRLATGVGNCCHLSGGTSPGRVLRIHSFTHRWAQAFCLVDREGAEAASLCLDQTCSGLLG